MNVADDWLIESPEDSYSPGPFHDQLSYNKVSSSSQQQQYYDNPFLDHHNGSHADQMPSHEDYKTVDDFLTQTLNDLDIPLDPNMSSEKYQHGHTLANGATELDEDYYEDMNMSINGISVSNMNTPVKKQHNKGKASGTAIFGFLGHNKTLSIPGSHGAGNGNLMFKGPSEEDSQQEDHDPTLPAVNMQEVDEDEDEEEDDDYEANDSTFPRFGLSKQPQPNLAPSSSEPQHSTLKGLKSPTVPREKILTANNDFIIPSKKDPNSYKFPPSPTTTVSESELTPALIQSKQFQDQQQQQQQKRRGSDYYQPPQHSLNRSSGQSQTVNLSSLTPTLQPSNNSKSAANMYQTPHSSPVKYQDPSCTVKKTITKKKSVKSLKRKEAKKTVEVSLEYLKKLESIIKEAKGKDVDIGIDGLREADAEQDEDDNNDDEEDQDDEEEEEEEESYEGQDQVESFPVHLNDEGHEHEDIQRRSSVFSHQSSMNSPIVQAPPSSQPHSSYSSPLKPKSSNTNANNKNNMMNMNANMNMGLGLGLFRPQSSSSTLSHQPTPPLANIPQFSYTDSTAATASNGPGYALNAMNNGMQGTNFYGNAMFGQQYGMQQFPQHQQPMAYFGYQPQFYGLTLQQQQQLAMAQFGGFGQGANHQVMQYPPMGQFQTNANVSTNTSVGLGLRYDSQRRPSQTQYSPSSKQQQQQQPAQQSVPVLQPLDLQPPALIATSTGSESSPSQSQSQSPILNPKETDSDDSVEQFNTKTPSPTLVSQAAFPNLDGSSVSPNRKKLQPPTQGTKGDLSWTPIIVNDSSFPNPASSATATAAVGSNAGELDMLGGSPSKKKPGEKISTLPPGQIDNYYTGPDVNKLYHCTFRNCDKTFTRRFNVRSHVQTHLCDRPFVCDYPGCMKSFVRHHDLTRHKKSHEEFVHSCECGKKFSRVDALVKHKERVLCVGGVGGRTGVIARGSSVRVHDVEDQTVGSSVGKVAMQDQRSPTKSPIKKKQSSTGIMAQQTMKMISFNDKLNNDGMNKSGKSPAASTTAAASATGSAAEKKKNELKVMQRLEHDILRSTNGNNNSDDHKSMVPPIMKIQPTSTSSASTSDTSAAQPSQNSNSSIIPDVPVNINYNATSTSDVDGAGSHQVYMGGFESYES